jgi:hypothetical protein
MITFTFDVESIGLHGEGFAFGYCVHQDGEEIVCGRLACASRMARGNPESRKWVEENIPPIPVDMVNPRDVRSSFWALWREWVKKDAIMLSDCGWPVEANFLSACVEDDHAEREWQGPYPLFDLSSILFALGCDPKGKYERRENELPVHDPLADARQTARIFWETRQGILPILAEAE